MKPITFSFRSNYHTLLRLSYTPQVQSGIFPRIYSVCLVVLLVQFYYVSDYDSKWIISIAFLGILITNFISRRSKYRSTPHIGEEFFWNMHEDGIDIKKGSFYFVHMGWDFITKFTENKHFFFIWYNNAEYIYFPKTAVSASELLEIKKLFFLNGKKGL